MRSMCGILALVLFSGCAGSDGKDGADGATGPAGPAGTNGRDGENGAPGPKGEKGEDGADGTNGEDGADGANGEDGADGANGEDGADGTNGEDGSAILQGAGAPAAGLGKDGDLYIDTASRDVYKKGSGAWAVITNLSGGPAGPEGDKGDKGDPGATGAAGSSVRTGSGAPAAGLGNEGDVYIDSATGDLYSKGAAGWAKTGSLKGPAGEDGEDGTDGIDVEDTVGGVRWFAFALTADYANAPNLVTSQEFTAASSVGTYTFTGAGQHGRLAFATVGSYLKGGVNLTAFETLTFSATVTGGATGDIELLLTDGDKNGCQWQVPTAGGPDYVVDLGDLSGTYGTAFSLESVTNVQIGVVSSVAGARTLTVTRIDLQDTL